jgi:hypothetical protein
MLPNSFSFVHFFVHALSPNTSLPTRSLSGAHEAYVVGVWGGGLGSLYIARAQIEVTGKCVEAQTTRCTTFPDAYVEEV